MQEETSGKVSFTAEEASTVTAPLSFMYGTLEVVSDELLLPLFKMTDQHQVLMACICCQLHVMSRVRHRACMHGVSIT